MRTSRARQAVAGALLVLAVAAAPRLGVAAEPKRTAKLDMRARTVATLSPAPAAVKVDAPPPPPADDGIFGPFRVGAVAGIGFPRPLSIEGLVKIESRVAFGLEYSALPTVSISDVDVRFNAIAADVRVFPLRGGFFVGIAAGHQHLGATTVVTLPQGLGALPEEVTADTWFINPRIGFLSTWSWGLTLGIDAGVQIPLSASFTNTIPTQLAASQTGTDMAHLFGKSMLPTVDLLKLGLLF